MPLTVIRASRDRTPCSPMGGGPLGYTASPIVQAVAAAAVVAANTYATEVLADSPTWYLKMAEASGVTATDSSTSALNGTYVNAPTLGSTAGPLTGAANTAATFASVSTQNVTRTANAAHDFGDTLTLEAWVKLAVAPGTTYRGVVAKGTNAYYLRINNIGKIEWVKDGVALIATGLTAISDTNWHHIAVTKATTTNKLYLDGIDDTGAVVNVAIGNSVIDLAAASDRGSGTASEYFDGSIAHLALYPTALSAVRIAAHYAAR